MTPQEQRGKWTYLFLAGLLILERLVGVGFALSGGLGEVNWLKSVVLPLGLCTAIWFLWTGDVWLRRLIGLTYLVYGGGIIFVTARLLVALRAKMGDDDFRTNLPLLATPLVVYGCFAIWDVTAGLVLLFSPSLTAFFRYQSGRQTLRLITFRPSDMSDLDDDTPIPQ